MSDDRTHVLVVEDDLLVLEMTQDALQLAGFEVTAVTAGEDALGLAVTDVPFDVLFTDIELAGPMNGWELAETMREMRPQIPVVYTSGRLSHPRTGEIRVPGSAFLPKPYSLFEVCRIMEQMPIRRGDAPAAARRPALVALAG